MNVHDPCILYGIRETASRLGLDVTPVSSTQLIEQSSGQFDALIVPETGLEDDLLRRIVMNSKCPVILVGPGASRQVDEFFGVETVGQTHDCFPEVSGWMKSSKVPEPLPVFYSIPVFRKLEEAPRVLAETEADGIRFPSVILKGERNCLARIGPQLFRSTAFLLTASGMKPFQKDERLWKDSYGRVRMDSTLVHARRYLRLPVVDYYARIMEELLFEMTSMKNSPLVQKWTVPRPQRFSVCLSHDVDHLAPPPLLLVPSIFSTSIDFRRVVGKAILTFLYFFSAVYTRNRDFLALIPRKLHRGLRNYEVIWGLDEISMSEQELGVRSSFFFLQNEHPLDSNYGISNPIVREAIRELSARGFEISFHAGFSTENRLNLCRQKRMLEEILGRNVLGVRTHFLRFSYPKTFRQYAEGGFCYDSSVMFSEEVGYRTSTCFPWMVFDVDTNTELPLMEIPPIIMDRTFKHMGLSPRDAQAVCTRLLSEISDLHGVLTIIWHNSGVTTKPGEHKAWWLVYWTLIQESLKRGACFLTLEDLFSYYVVRRRIKILATQVNGNTCEIALDSELDYPLFPISISLRSKRISSAKFNGRVLPANSVVEIDKQRFIVSVPIARGRSLLSITMRDQLG